MQEEFKNAGHDDSIESAVGILGESFANAKQMLVEKAEEMGIDVEAVMVDPEIGEAIEKTRRKIEDAELGALSKKYAMDLMPLMESIEMLLGEHAAADPTTAEMIEIIHWYQFLIAAKCHRALHGLVDIGGEDTTE